jgi:predicted nuclease of restriction endonuclease-like (RecB) superfamily
VKKKPAPQPEPLRKDGYTTLLGSLTKLLEDARRASARSVNAVMTATYWEMGRRIVEHEQGGVGRAEYGAALLKRLSLDLTSRFGRGFSERNLEQMRLFYLGWPISQTPSAESRSSRSIESNPEKSQTLSAEFHGTALRTRFPLSWSHYVRLLSVEDPEARAFYEAEALRGGWSVRQLDRQISTLFYERTALSRDKAKMLSKGAHAEPSERPTSEEEIKDPLVLEFLGLKDEYSESALEEALIRHLEHFLLELGNDFTFVARQKRLRVGDEWYRIDLLFFHRRLRCLIVIDLKIGKFTHADAGQMNLYLNYAKEHWTHLDENPPIGLILCAKGDEAVAHYALGGLSNKVFASRYKLQLPDPKVLQREIEAERRRLEQRVFLKKER